MTSSASGGDPDSSAAEAAFVRRMSPPDNEVPGAIAYSVLLGRNDDLAVVLIGGAAFSNGISLNIAVRLRRAGDPTHGLGGEIFRNQGRGTGFLIGVEYPDGRTTSNVSDGRFPDAAGPERPFLSHGGGGGGGRTYDLSYWLSPLPPPGDLIVVTAWPSRSLSETRVAVPADAIAEAVARVSELWPWSEPRDDEPAAPPKLDLPAGGWFAEHASDQTDPR